MATTASTTNNVTDLKTEVKAEAEKVPSKVATEFNEIKDYWKGVAAHPTTRRLAANTVKYGIVGLAVTTIDIAIKA